MLRAGIIIKTHDDVHTLYVQTEECKMLVKKKTQFQARILNNVRATHFSAFYFHLHVRLYSIFASRLKSEAGLDFISSFFA